MSRFRTIESVSMHREGYYGTAYPALNVKCYTLPDPDAVVTRFGCSAATAERALEWAVESHREDFWGPCGPDSPYPSRAQDALREAFGDAADKLEIWAAGRSGGWLIVRGLPPVEEWRRADLARWSVFAREIAAEIAYLSSEETLLDTIEANGWADPEPQDAGLVVAMHSVALAELYG